MMLVGFEHANVVDKWLVSLIENEQLNGFGIVLYVLLVLLIAGGLTAVIGLGRYKRGSSAGMRTHAFLGIGCAFLMIISVWAIKLATPDGTVLEYDATRIAAGAITGIGFLGAGVIIKDGFTIRGLSTAATLWICAAIGLASGAGFVLEAAVAALITLGSVYLMNKIIVSIDNKAPHVVIKAKHDYPALERIKEISDAHILNIKHTTIVEYDADHAVYSVCFPFRSNPYMLDYFITELKKDDGVIEATRVVKK